jgi:hypothetical protein
MLNRSFSSHNLILQRFHSMIQPIKSRWNPFKQDSAWVPLHIKLPQYDILRAEIFLDDLLELTEHEYTMTVTELLALLYSDFIRQVQTGKTKHLLTLSKRLQQKHDKLLRPMVLVKQYREDKPNHWILEEKLKPVSFSMYSLPIEIKRTSVLRGEIFLHDLASVNQTFSLTLEQLIATLFMEFMEQVKTGKTIDAVHALLESASR